MKGTEKTHMYRSFAASECYHFWVINLRPAEATILRDYQQHKLASANPELKQIKLQGSV